MSGNPAPSRRRTARAALLVAIPVMLVALTACSEGPFGLPAASTEQAHHVGNLWLGAWIASLVIGGIVWSLGLLIVGSFVIEGAVGDWGGVYLADVLHASVALAPLKALG